MCMLDPRPSSVTTRSRPNRMPIIALCLGTVAAVALCSASRTHAAEPPISAAERGKEPSFDAGSSDNLSERLNQSGGVIKPPENVDPEIQKKPPDTSGKMPIIPPPGAPGGDPNVKPK